MYGLERHLGAATKKLRAPGGAAPGCSATTQPCGLGTGGGCPGCWRGGAQGDSQRVSACTAPPTHTHTHAHVCTSTHTPTASSHTRTPTVTDTHEVSPCELPSTGGDSSPWLEAPGGSGQVGGVGRVPSPWASDTHQSLEGGGDRPARDSPLLGGPTRHSAGGGPSHPNHCPTPRARPLRVRI